MVYTIEPGLYIPEWGMGIRIEDDALILKDKNPEILSISIPKKLKDVYEFIGV
jgi:Xaa-Pro aminopeptidase